MRNLAISVVRPTLIQSREKAEKAEKEKRARGRPLLPVEVLKKQLSIWMSSKDMDILDYEADKEGTSRSTYCRNIIEQHIEDIK